jgi:hypothetical protein
MTRLIFTLIVFFSYPALAYSSVLNQQHDFTLQYGVYGGGFQALSISIHFEFTGKTYCTTMNAKPYGVLGHLLPWAGWYTTTGHIRNKTLIPQSHEKQSAWRDDKSHLRVTYDAMGKLIRQERDERENGKTHTSVEKIDPTFHKDTIDILTSVLNMLAKGSDLNNCNNRDSVYDGKRRFDMVFTDKGTDTLQKTKYNIAQGTVRKCQLELKPLAGFTGKPRGFYKIQEQGRALGQLPLVWIAPMWQNGPMAPVKLMLKSDYGAVFVHVQGVKRKLNEN